MHRIQRSLTAVVASIAAAPLPTAISPIPAAATTAVSTSPESAEPAAAAPAIQVGLLGPLETLEPLDTTGGVASIALRALPGEVESFQVVVRGDGQELTGAAVAVGTLSGPGGATISNRSLSVYREAYTRIWTPSDQEGWCRYFDPASQPYCGVPIDGADPDAPENVSWKCGKSTVAPILDPRLCQVPDALIPERDTFYGEDRNAFPMTVPAGENRMAWVDVAVPVNTPAGTYTGVVTVSAAGAPSVTRSVSIQVEGVELPAYGTDPVTDLLGGVNVNPTLCQAHGCSTGDATSYRLMSLYGRAGLENRMPILNPSPKAPEVGVQRDLFDRWVKPLLTGSAVVDPDGALLPPRLPGAHLTEVLLNQHTGPAGWRAWQLAARSSSFETQMRFYCDEVYSRFGAYATAKATFEGECANPYDAAVGPGGWDTTAAPLRSSLIGNQTHQTLTEQWGSTTPRGSYRVVDAVNTRIPVANDLDRRDGITTRGSYDAPGGFLATPGRDLWIYTSNSATGAGDGWTPHQFWNGWPGIAGVDQPATSERAGPVMAWISRTTGHYFYDAFNRLPQAWNDCSTTPSSCLYTFGSHGDGTLYYPGTVARVGGQHAIPIESMRLKRYRDGAEDYALLQLLDTGCHGQCSNLTRTELLDIVGNPNTRTGLFPYMYTTDTTGAAYARARTALLDLLAASLPAVANTSPPAISGTPQVGATLTSTGGSWNPADVTKSYRWLRDGVLIAGATASSYPLVPADQGTHVGVQVTASKSGYRDAVATSSAVGPIAAPPFTGYRPDGLIRRAGVTSYLGDDVYNRTGTGQTWRETVARGDRRTFWIKVENDGTRTDSYSVVGTGAGDGFTTTYLAGSADITGQVVTGNLGTGDLAPGGSRTYQLVIKATSRVSPDTVRFWNVHAVSYRASAEAGENVRDTVRLRLRAG